MRVEPCEAKTSSKKRSVSKPTGSKKKAAKRHPRKPQAKRNNVAKASKAARAASDDGGSADPVRVYLREMGQVSLLTREGEVEIAQRIEVAVDAHLAALIGNSYCLRRMIEVGEFVREGRIELKKVIDGLDDEEAAPEEELRQKFLEAITRLEAIEKTLTE